MDRSLRAPTDDVLAIQLICSIYVGQLLSGCGNSKCINYLCITGRNNTSASPVRKFTPRSARAIALAVASTATPRKYLCRYYILQPPTTESQREDEGPRDPSAFIQQLCDTWTVRALCNHKTLQPDDLCQKFMIQYNQRRKKNDGLRRLHKQLDSAMLHPYLGSNGQPHPNFQHNSSISNTLHETFLWLHRQIPRASPTAWIRANHNISMADARQTPPSSTQRDYASYVAILDVLNDGQLNYLLTKLCMCLSHRLKMDNHNSGRVYFRRGDGRTVYQRLQLHLTSWSSNFLRDSRADGLILMLKKVFLESWDGTCRLQRRSAACGALEFMELMREADPRPDELPFAMVYHLPSAINRLNVAEAVQDWMDGDTWPYLERHILTFRSLLPNNFLAFNFKMTNHLKMRSAHSEAETASELGRRVISDRPVTLHKGAYDQHQYLEAHYLLLNVSRSNVMQDAFDQLWQRRRSELFRPLRVRLGEIDELEVGHDLGGVQIEFFNLLCRELFAEDRQIFTTDATTGLSYFRPCSLQPLHYFELIGVLMSLAIYNGITLPISMPVAFYRKLLSLPCHALEHIEDGWPVISRSLRTLLQLEDEVDGLQYSFPLEANGLRMSVRKSDLEAGTNTMMAIDISQQEAGSEVQETFRDRASGREVRTWPGWCLKFSDEAPQMISQANKQAYVRDYIDWVTTASIWPQWQAFQKGFFTCLSPRGLSLLTPSSLQRIVEGTQHIDIAALQRATKYDGYDAKSKCIQWFWGIMESWSEGRQRQLLKFVTAIERIPVNGNIIFCIKRAVGVDSEALPTSSTCFGTLQLPRYDSREVLENKLNVAIEYGLEGFGSG